MTEAAIKLPQRARYTVGDLFEIPDDGHRYEVFGGSLVMSPAPAPMHQILADGLRSLLQPHRAIAVNAVAIRITDDGETWRTVEAPAGQAHELPVAVGPDSWITVALDPAELVNL